MNWFWCLLVGHKFGVPHEESVLAHVHHIQRPASEYVIVLAVETCERCGLTRKEPAP